ncbi:MAG: DUF2877 domain-containing protein [Desulfofustis sp.]|nr:DUF2877 domain-containing protein [Desulfofustis sp.]
MKSVTVIDAPRQIVGTESVGRLIGPLLAGAAGWRIIQVYRHCFYCLSDAGDVICIGDASIDRGPFTIICTEAVAAAAAAQAGNRDIVSNDGTMLLGDRLVIDTTRSALWVADFFNCGGSGANLDPVLSMLTETAGSTAPQQSLGSLLPALFTRELVDQKRAATTAVLHRRLLQVVDSVRRDSAFADPERLASLLIPLIGLGYGLTPSGDDFCAGSVLSLVAVGKPEQAVVLARNLFQAARNRTTVISLAFYRALGASLLFESQARLLGCIGDQQDPDLGDALHGVYRHGATSGWDLLAGFAFGLDLFSHEKQLSEPVGSAGGWFSQRRTG